MATWANRWASVRLQWHVRRQGSWVHRSLEVRGRRDAHRFVSIGPGCAIERQSTVSIADVAGADPQVRIGARCFFGRNFYLDPYLPITVGNDVIVGAYSYLTSGNHRYARRDVPIQDQGMEGAPIVIEDDVWLGTHVVVLPGAHIGRGAIVAAGSVVRGVIPPYEIWGGVPAAFRQRRP